MLSYIQSYLWSILSKIRYFLYYGLRDLLWPPLSRESQDVDREDFAKGPLAKEAGKPCFPEQLFGSLGTKDPELANMRRRFSHDPYLDLPVIGIGMTGIVFKIDDDRVVKKAKIHSLEHLSEQDRANTEYVNDINRETLAHEIKVYERLGSHRGIIPHFQVSQYGIELAFAKHGNLEFYLETNPEPEESLKINWILSLIETFSYIHSRRVFVDDIALRNILILDKRLKLADFGQSILLPLHADVNTICENDLTAQIEILHLGWIIFSIASWRVHKYYFFSPENLHWPKPDSLPSVDNLSCGDIIRKCWHGEYASMDALKDEAHSLIDKRSPQT